MCLNGIAHSVLYWLRLYPVLKQYLKSMTSLGVQISIIVLHLQWLSKTLRYSPDLHHEWDEHQISWREPPRKRICDIGIWRRTKQRKCDTGYSSEQTKNGVDSLQEMRVCVCGAYRIAMENQTWCQFIAKQHVRAWEPRLDIRSDKLQQTEQKCIEFG